MTRLASLLLCALSLALAGCSAVLDNSWSAQLEASGSITPTIQDPDDVKYYPSDEPLRLGLEYFGRGAFGTAERHLRDAVEKAPEDRAAWIALAATYDRLGRFDLADKAYHAAIKLGGETVQILNNRGYSYMLRGDLRTARAKFDAALALDPQNQTILNNLQLLANSDRLIQRQSATIN